ncbi:MAG: hypothetical protein HY905_12535 [Deltaproteobacteria bacterium]|nr:hypothetical protein [Deltaproteobacteria bacterium]
MQGGLRGFLFCCATMSGLAACGSVNSGDSGDDVDPGDAVEDGAADGDGDVGPDGDLGADADGEGDGPACETGTWCEGAGCVEMDTDPLHCGTCDNTCSDGLNADAACEGGHCALSCRDGWVDADSSPGCEYACTPSDPPTEACNGLDDDCNGAPDDPFECIFGSTAPCSTSCGTTGISHCGATCTWTCTPPEEVCDGADQDCDTVADNGPYAVLWDVEALVPSSGRGIISFSPAVQGTDIGVGYVLASAAGSVLGQPKLQLVALADGSSGGRLPENLTTESTAQSIGAASSLAVGSYFWTTGDDSGGGSETAVLRSAAFDPAFVLGAVGAIDATASPSNGPCLARLGGMDTAIAAWIEYVAGTPREVRLATASDYVAPGIDARVTIADPSGPSSPSIAVQSDSTILVVWTSGSPGQIVGRRLNTGLELLGEEIVLSGAGAGAATVPRVAASETRFMVVWQEEDAGVVVASVLPDGTLGIPATTLASAGSAPVVAPDLMGGFAVAYETTAGVEVARISAAGVMGGPPLVVAGAHRPEITTIPEGGLILAYDAEGTVRLARFGCTP